MKIQLKEDVVYAYNKNEKVLSILGADENSTMYKIGGWFGKKLHALLKDSIKLEEFLSSSEDEESKDIMMRLITTLILKSILNPLQNNNFKKYTPLDEHEWVKFGLENDTGGMSYDILSARAHNSTGRINAPLCKRDLTPPVVPGDELYHLHTPGAATFPGFRIYNDITPRTACTP